MVVGWGTDDVLVAALDDEQMPILDTCDEPHAVVAKVAVQVFHQLVGVFGRQMAAMMVFDAPVGQTDDVAAYGHVVGLHLVADGGGFQGAASFIHLVKVVAHDGGVGHFRPRRESFGHRDEAACAPIAGKQVHERCVGIL